MKKLTIRKIKRLDEAPEEQIKTLKKIGGFVEQEMSYALEKLEEMKFSDLTDKFKLNTHEFGAYIQPNNTLLINAKFVFTNQTYSGAENKYENEVKEDIFNPLTENVKHICSKSGFTFKENYNRLKSVVIGPKNDRILTVKTSFMYKANVTINH